MARSPTPNASPDPRRQPVRIVIAEELPIFRDGLRLLLGPDARLEVVGGIDVGPAVAVIVSEVQPDILLLGCSSSGDPALEVLKSLAASGVSVRTILLVKSIDTPEITEALKFGACGVVVRDSAPDLLFKSIDAVMAGQYWIGHESATGDVVATIRRLEHARDDARRFGLTRRELEIVHGVVNGATNREIAVRLKISESTVKRHIANVFNKVGCSTRVELALFAAYHRLLRDI